MKKDKESEWLTEHPEEEVKYKGEYIAIFRGHWSYLEALCHC